MESQESKFVEWLLSEFPKSGLFEQTADSLLRSIHEAGHAVVAAHLGVIFEETTIITNGHRSGSCRFPDQPLNDTEMIRNFIKALLGGMSAHACYMPSLNSEYIDCSGTFDYEAIGEVLEKLQTEDRNLVFGDLTEREYLLNLGIETCDLLKTSFMREALFTVAHELMREKTLSAERVKELYHLAKNVI